MTALERNGILAGGNWVLDHTKIIDFFPAQDALANVLAETSSNGGGPYNVLIDLARLGAPFPLAAVGVLVTTPEASIFVTTATSTKSTRDNYTSLKRRQLPTPT